MSMPSDADKRATRPLALAIGLILMALLLGVVLVRQNPPQPAALDAPPGQFSASRALALLQQFLPTLEPHPVGSEASEPVVERIKAAFEDLGYEVDVQDTVACRSRSGTYTQCAPVRNLVTRLPGQEAGPALMLAAHHDSVRAGPGVADDMSNVATILEIARILKEQGPYRNSVLFLVTDAEEYGLLGAQGFVDSHPWAQDVAVVLNLEARGTRGLSFMFETSAGNRWLIDAYASAVRRPASSSLHYEVYKILPRDTDLTVFRAGGMAGLNFAYIDRDAHYHTPLDNFEYLDLRSVQHQGDGVLAVAQELAGADLANPPAGDAHWTDLLGLATIHWPASWTMPIAIALLLLLLVVAIRLVRRRQATVGGLLLGLLAGLLCLLLSVLLGLGLTWLIRLVAGVQSPWHAYALPTRVALWAGAVLCGGLVAAALGRRAGTWALSVGIWLLWAILGLVLSLTLTGPAILFLLPAIVAALLLALIAFSPLAGSAPAREAGLVAAALAAGVIWLPFALAFESAVHFDLSPAVTVAVGLAVSALVPLMALPRGETRLRRWLLAATALVMVVATVVAMVVPPFTPSDPQQVRLYYLEDRSQGSAHWVADSEQGPLPQALAGWFEAEPSAVFPWIEAPYLAGTAPAGTTAAPVLEVLSDQPEAGGRLVEARLRSPAGGSGTMLFVPAAAMSRIEIEGYDYPVQPEEGGTGYYSLQCNGRGCDGLGVRLHLRGTGPIEVLVADVDSGLPAAGQALLQARPPEAVTSFEGDLTIVYVRVDL